VIQETATTLVPDGFFQFEEDLASSTGIEEYMTLYDQPMAWWGDSSPFTISQERALSPEAKVEEYLTPYDQPMTQYLNCELALPIEEWVKSIEVEVEEYLTPYDQPITQYLDLSPVLLLEEWVHTIEVEEHLTPMDQLQAAYLDCQSLQYSEDWSRPPSALDEFLTVSGQQGQEACWYQPQPAATEEHTRSTEVEEHLTPYDQPSAWYVDLPPAYQAEEWPFHQYVLDEYLVPTDQPMAWWTHQDSTFAYEEWAVFVAPPNVVCLKAFLWNPIGISTGLQNPITGNAFLYDPAALSKQLGRGCTDG
jgi:hypothetical protein